MKTFADNAGRTWSLAVNVDAIKRVKSLLDINLLDVLDDRCQLLARLAGDDPLLLVDVLVVLCQPAADEQRVNDVDFGRAMAGDAILHGAEALLSELAADPQAPWDLLERIGPHMAFTEPFNVTGQPTISLPLHWTPEGLPVGVQLVAAIGREDLLISVASQLEREAPWSGRRPPIHA